MRSSVERRGFILIRGRNGSRHSPVRGDSSVSIIRNIVVFLVEVPPPGVGGMVVRRGGKKGKNKGGEKRFPATERTARRPCFPFPLIRECAPFRERSERNLQLARERHIIHRTSTTCKKLSFSLQRFCLFFVIENIKG